MGKNCARAAVVTSTNFTTGALFNDRLCSAKDPAKAMLNDFKNVFRSDGAFSIDKVGKNGRVRVTGCPISSSRQVITANRENNAPRTGNVRNNLPIYSPLCNWPQRATASYVREVHSLVPIRLWLNSLLGRAERVFGASNNVSCNCWEVRQGWSKLLNRSVQGGGREGRAWRGGSRVYDIILFRSVSFFWNVCVFGVRLWRGGK